MRVALDLLAVLAFLGAFDTLYYHEWRAKLPGLGRQAKSELQLHAFRDFVYAVLFVGVPWLTWHGWYALALMALFIIEIALTLWDFVVEDLIRRPLGGLYAGERIMHGIMGIVYGAMLAYIVPTLRSWWSESTKLIVSSPPIGTTLHWVMILMAVGVFLSGVRDFCASVGVRNSGWPWVNPLDSGAQLRER